MQPSNKMSGLLWLSFIEGSLQAEAAKNYCRAANWTGSPAELKACLGTDQGP